MNRNFSFIAIISVGILISLAIFFMRSSEKDVLYDNKNPVNSSPAVGISDNVRPPDRSDHILGNPNAPVKIIEFSDLECLFCKVFHSTMLDVMESYGKSGKVAWVYRHLPIDTLHSKARTEAVAAECAGELGGGDVFWEYIKKIFEVTPSDNGLNLGLLPEIAHEFGIDTAEFKECLESGKYDAHIEEDLNDAINSGASGAPYSIAFIKNKKTMVIPGSKDSEIILLIIDKMLKEL